MFLENINCQIECRRLNLLNHKLVHRWIQKKWQRAQIIYIILLVAYSSFLAMLTALTLVAPRPADNVFCKLHSCIMVPNKWYPLKVKCPMIAASQTAAWVSTVFNHVVVVYDFF